MRRGSSGAQYSVHDLRHAFAVKLNKETKDIYLVEKARGHASVAVTEIYLRSLVDEVGGYSAPIHRCSCTIWLDGL